jgi:hypothetical protein
VLSNTISSRQAKFGPMSISGRHHRRWSFHHQCRSASQQARRLPLMYVARVADAGLVEHKQRVHQRGAQRY